MAACGLLVGGCVGELAARMLYDRPWYDHLSEIQEENETLDYQMNDYGLRGDNFVSPKPEGTRRVYMAGDSFTFGMGVADGSLVMPSLVEKNLNGSMQISGVDRFEVLNGGMLKGSLPRHWQRKWQRIQAPFDPDVVLIVFFLRDGTNTGSIPAFFNVIRDEITAQNDSSFWYRNLYLYRLFKDRRDRDLVAGRYTDQFKRSYFGTKAEQKEWISAQYNMLEIKKSAEARGAVVGLVTYPILVDLDEGRPYPFQDICDLLADFARDHDIPLLELLPHFRGKHGPSLWVSPFDQHPNPKGHAIAAEAVTPFVEELLRKKEQQGKRGSP